MSKKNLLFVLETVLLVAVSASLAGCGSSRISSPATPAVTASHRLDTGSLGLPLYCPKYITHDQQGNLYVADSDTGYKENRRARVVKLSPSGHLLAEWHVFNTFQSQPSFLGSISGPFGIAVDASGIIYVADAGDNTIMKLSPTGKVLAIWGKTGRAPGELSWPQGVAVDAHGNVYVADSNNSRIEKFSSSGTLLAVFGNTGSAAQRLNLPAGIALDAQGDVYVGDLRNHRLAKFSPQGRFLAAWSGAGGIQFSSARGVAIDRTGNIYITDARNLRIVKFSLSGKVLAVLQRPMDPALFGITVDPQGNIYVAMTALGLPNFGLTGGIRKLSPSGTVLATWPATCPA